MTDTTTKFFLDTVRDRLKRAKDANRVDVKIPARDLALLLELAETKSELVFDLAALAAFGTTRPAEVQHVGPSVIVVPATEEPLPPGTVVCSDRSMADALEDDRRHMVRSPFAPNR